GTTFTFKATVVDIVRGSKWFYMACQRCSIKHAWRNGKPWCIHCRRRVRKAVPIYRIELIVADSMDTAIVIALGEKSEPLLNNVKISKLMQISNINIKENKAENILEIWNAIPVTFIFEVHLNTTSFNYDSFSIQHIYPLDYALEAKYTADTLTTVTILDTAKHII
ncbi:hypothetical protein MKW94_001047, partial [Papaver nudicaule]|nr:hypothetical protein [Papaver nudicaule]